MYVKVEFENRFIDPGTVDSGCQKSAISLSCANKLSFNSEKAKSERTCIANEVSWSLFLKDPRHLRWIESAHVKSYGECVDKSLMLMKTVYEIVNQHRLRVRMKG
uniref:Uncharacterized protein n=1 Tax=Strongyloides papillosus TaxID=174720 RepID=A0A0N5CC49_STREA